MSEPKEKPQTQTPQQKTAVKPEVHVHQYIIPGGAVIPTAPVRPVGYPVLPPGLQLMRRWLRRRRGF